MSLSVNASLMASNAEDRQSLMQQRLRQLLTGRDLERGQAQELLDLLIAPESSDAMIAAVLIALAQKGESEAELAGLAAGMRARMIHLPTRIRAIDTAGTGASRAKTFNVSTAAAFVIAAAGLPIAKHGARASTSRSGSADVLTALGVAIDVPTETAARSLESLGVCFLFAPKYHAATARVAPIRRQLGVRTCFNLIGPLCNPASTPWQVMGVGDRSFQRKVAGALSLLGCERAWVAHGEDGLDELSLETPTFIAEATPGGVREFVVAPEDFGLRRADCSHLRGGDAAANAEIVRGVLSGERTDAARDLVALNAAAALHVALGLPWKDASAKALSAIADGSALGKLNALRAMYAEARA